MESKRKNKKLEVSSYKKIAVKVSIVSIFVNLLLSIIKLLAGIFAKSGAMISDSVHSASDVFTTFVVILGVNLACKKSDAEHQYGHERLECVVSIILAAILFAVGAGIGVEGIKKIFFSKPDSLVIPGGIALVTAVISIVVKEWMYWYTRLAAKKINSGALMADAWHHRSDALSSIGAFIGILGARMGFPILDPIASVVICVFIIKAAIDVFKDSIDKLVDKSCDEEIVEKMKEVILKEDGVIQIDDIRTRLFGSKIYVDIEISADEELKLKDSHDISQRVHDVVEKEFDTVKHCMVHVNPIKNDDK